MIFQKRFRDGQKNGDRANFLIHLFSSFDLQINARMAPSVKDGSLFINNQRI